ncbi:dienelactone hydrolase family protein [Ulvibacter litoralis]|uniref:Dienelactone hydrolase n=1 Tax=Ulvibacter litoralis TaxID=227084 RepID=A0A1G7J3U6_9FLAO|nr:dienelactone hydrolase family protein [Ulvibacter litoralis]GHC60713.1 dienelactone hydrolase [Ulvibacter litoralis]SDF19528.1 Dienelactone hydrolase [Ulvibacter litoralis]
MSKQNLQNVIYQDDGIILNGLITSNQNKNFPGVLILPAWYGIDEEAKQAAINLQQQGYTAFIADIYGTERIPTTPEEASKASKGYKQNFELYQRRIVLAINELIKAGANHSRIAVIGFCFGGTGALEAARGKLPVTGVVCIHGDLYKNPNRKNNKIRSQILIIHPANDHTVSKDAFEKIQHEMEESQADWQIISCGNSKHTFTNPSSPDFNETMANRTWMQIILFLDEILK